MPMEHLDLRDSRWLLLANHNEVGSVQQTHSSFFKLTETLLYLFQCHLEYLDIVTAAAGLELANFSAQKWAWLECKSGCDPNFPSLCWRAPPIVRNLGQILYSVDHLVQAWLSVVRNWEVSAIQVFLLYINHSKFSQYIKQCPLLGRSPLLGVSANGELTVTIFWTVKESTLHEQQLHVQMTAGTTLRMMM